MTGINTTKNKPVKSGNIFGQPLSIFGVPVDRDIIFANHKGVYKRSVEKRQRALIVKSTFIKFFLRPDEQIRCLTTGYSPISVMEQVATGPFFLLFKRALFIFTAERILHVPTRFGRTPRGAVSQILFEDCARLSIKGRTLQVQYKNGRQESFPYLALREKQKIRALIADLCLSPKDAGQLQDRVHLCPSCTNLLLTHGPICETCKTPFKTTFKAKLRAFLIPGGGYFYARYSLMGMVVALLEIYLIAALAFKWVEFNNGITTKLGLLALLSLGLIFVKLAGAFHSALLVSDFVPEEHNVAVRKI